MAAPGVGHTPFSWLGGALAGPCTEAGAAPAPRAPRGHTELSWLGRAAGAASARALGLNKLGGVLQRRGELARACVLYEAALAQDPCCLFARLNLGVAQGALGRHGAAERSLAAAALTAPGFGPALDALAGALLARGSPGSLQGACELCLASLRLGPSAQAHQNLGNALRRLGRGEEAVRMTREALGMAPCGPEAGWLRSSNSSSDSASDSTSDSTNAGVLLSVVCVKWGSKYGAEYVNTLRRAVRRHLAVTPHRFVCFTDDPGGLDAEVFVLALPDAGYDGWWSKASALFWPGLAGALARCGPGGADRVLYFDLDTVILGPLDELAAYRGPLALLGTDDFGASEGRRGGYNSSVMLFSAHDDRLRCVLEAIERAGLARVKELVHRLDYWLETCVPGADVLQELFPGQLVDYKSHCAAGRPPPGARVVNFPLKPKPHECKEDWVREHWR